MGGRSSVRKNSNQNRSAAGVTAGRPVEGGSSNRQEDSRGKGGTAGRIAAASGQEDDNFFIRVWEVTRLVPFGRVTSYGAIARYLGSGRSARMVGWALNSSVHDHGFIPAHRVVNRNGMLTGKHHFGTPGTMQQLLENEGFTIEDDRVVEFAERFWDPSAEL